MKKNPPFCLLFFLLVLLSCKNNTTDNNSISNSDEVAATSLLGKPLFASKPSAELLEKYNQHKKAFDSAPYDVEKLIWYGRFTAYQGKYKEAISIFKKGIEQFPQDARLYRHRGHRYISIRQFDQAIADFEKAVELIQGKQDEIEPDGIPNAQNIPVSTLQGNIYYHLG
ncbi:tetratricopeptide repeat protein [Flavobacterium sp.]|uniref:tetratricopeptide repeat protein n=1 Tax=Flavobacterium sp. TaxID=239 RepID=UPI00374CF734